MLIYLMPLMCLSCDYSAKFWCDSFNGHSSCYSNVLCSTYSSSMIVRTGLLYKYESLLASLLKTTDCSYPQFILCTDTDWDDYSECVYESNCEELLSPSFLSLLPEDVWIAIKPKGLLSESVEDDEYKNYGKFQHCLGRCEEVCEASLEDKDRECVENCILTFCV